MERGILIPAGRARLVLAAVAIAAAVWVAVGVRVLDPERSFAVLEIPALHHVRVLARSRFVIAPPGITRATVFSRAAVRLELPRAAIAMLPSADGSRFGLRGTVVLRADPARARELAAAAAGDGLAGVVLAAVRASASEIQEAVRGERLLPHATRGFLGRLRGELTQRGVEVEALDLEGFDDLAATSDVLPLPSDVRVLLVGLDGADWEILDPLLRAGRLPHLERLVRDGVRVKLLSITPILSPVVWTSIATGVEPARHGIMDFLTLTASGASEPVSSRQRRVPAIWELLSDAGADVAVTGWWATWPADHVRGAMVTDRVAYQLFGYRSDERSAEGKTWPPDLYDMVRARLVPPDRVPWSDVEPYLEGDRRTLERFDGEERQLLDEFRTLIASGKTYLDVALALRRQFDPRFEAVYFEGTDVVGHLFMPYRAPELASVPPARFASFRSVVDRYYETADRMLGRLLEGRDDWIVIVLSDHGFASGEARPLTTDSRIGHGAAADWHRRFGILVMHGPGIRRGARLEEASVYDIAPTILALFGQPVPKSWPGSVLGRAFEPEILQRRPVRFRETDPVRASSPAVAEEGDAEAQELREKLESLGYVASTSATPMTTKNNRGVTLLADGRYEDAATAFREAIADDPNQPTLWVNLGIALRNAGKTDEATALLERALAMPATRRVAGHQLAQIALESGDLRQAEVRLREVLAHEPGAADVRNSLGLVLERDGRVSEAKAVYEEATRMDPYAAEPRNNLGNLARQARMPDAAERWYLAAIEADPHFMGAYNNLALLYQERGEVGKAIELYGRALAKAPRNAVVLNNLASIYFATGEHDEARRLWLQAVDVDPSYPSPLNNLAGLALARGELEDASALLERALALDGGYGDALINRSLIARRRGDLVRARRDLEQASHDPRSRATAHLQRGFLELDAGDPRAAALALEQARRDGGETTEVLNALGDAYARLGEQGKAVAVWQRSLALDPTQDRIIKLVN